MQPEIEIRHATPADVSAMLEIYRPHVEEMATSFEYICPSEEEFTERLQGHQKTHPWIVAWQDDVCLGYAYATPWKSRAAYRWSAEVTVYVNASVHRTGVGRKLYEHLFELLEKQGICNLIAGITMPNDGSVAFHESLGFVKCAEFADVGYKFEKWHSVGYWERRLDR